MKIGIRREQEIGERRVAATPETVRQYVDAGFNVSIEAGAGAGAGYSDDGHTAAGADIVADVELASTDVLLHVRPLTAEVIGKLSRGAITVGFATVPTGLREVGELRDAGVTAFALELVPRISRAQSMDALTSQSLIAGYRCVLEAAMRYPRFFPLYMTAAGTVPPARVLVLGAGVAGLQAIATARRLGAKVSAYDVRAASADEVASMGGTFINLDFGTADGAGGYAQELAEDRAARQRELLAPFIADADVVITTAALPGRPAPRLVTAGMLSGMRPGSVVVDLAAESGGNVEDSVPGEDTAVPVTGGAITLVGMRDAASSMPFDASRLLARNIANLVELMTVAGKVTPDFEDEVVRGTCMTHDGQVLHEPTAAALAALEGTTAPLETGAR